MRSSIPLSVSFAWVYLFILSLGYAALGWLLTAFQVSWLVWMGTLSITLHLVKTGADAIDLASAWIVIVISAGAVAKAWMLGDLQFPYHFAQLWAMGLLALWLGTLGLAVLLAFAAQPMRLVGRGIVRGSNPLLILVWAALGMGGLLYHVMY